MEVPHHDPSPEVAVRVQEKKAVHAAEVGDPSDSADRNDDADSALVAAAQDQTDHALDPSPKDAKAVAADFAAVGFDFGHAVDEILAASEDREDQNEKNSAVHQAENSDPEKEMLVAVVGAEPLGPLEAVLCSTVGEVASLEREEATA